MRRMLFIAGKSGVDSADSIVQQDAQYSRARLA